MNSAATVRRNLVVARIGGKSLHRSWLAEPSAQRNWDLQLSVYDPELEGTGDGDFDVSVDFGTKWDSICRYFRARPQLLDAYDFVMFPDDDLAMAEGTISRLFAIAAEHRLDMAQPALLPESHFAYAITLHCPQFRLRYTNYVEPMCPIIRAAYLKELLPLLERWPTGWGQDDIWALLMPDPAYRTAIIDAAPVLHTRPLYTGNLYQTFTRLGMDPNADLAEIRASFAGLPGAKLVYGGVSVAGERVGAAGANFRNGIRLLRIAPLVRACKITVFTGIGMLVRIFTRARYRPIRLCWAAPTGAADAAGGQVAPDHGLVGGSR